MENRIDKEEFRFIDVAFFQKTNLRLVASIDIDGKASLIHLQHIIESNKPIIKTLCLERDEVKRSYKRATGIMSNGKNILEYHFIWARMIVEFYYFYYETKENRLKIINQMLSYEDYQYIKEAVQKGMSLVDEYFESEWNENTSANPTITRTKHNSYPLRLNEVKESFMHNSQESAKTNAAEPLPDILQVMEDINSGKIRYTDVDWERQLKFVVKLCDRMTTKMPHIIWLWGLLSSIEDPTKRMDILGKMQDVAYRCIDSVYDARQFREDCACIYNIYSRVREYNINGAKVIHVWTDERKSLNDLAHILSDEVVDPKWLVVLANDIYCMVQDNKREELLACVLRAHHPIDMLNIDNIVDFAKNLYIAEGFRRYILSGKTDYMDLPTIDSFEPKLLKACFEEYIRQRSLYIKDSIERELTHVGEAEELECLERLQEEENQVINRENSLEEFYGSAAYRAMWYPGKPQVLKMINTFSTYLQNKIKKERKNEAVKQAGLHIEHIDNFAMGDNVQNKIEKQ